jgi:hypothetical protein
MVALFGGNLSLPCCDVGWYRGSTAFLLLGSSLLRATALLQGVTNYLERGITPPTALRAPAQERASVWANHNASSAEAAEGTAALVERLGVMHGLCAVPEAHAIRWRGM